MDLNFGLRVLHRLQSGSQMDLNWDPAWVSTNKMRRSQSAPCMDVNLSNSCDLFYSGSRTAVISQPGPPPIISHRTQSQNTSLSALTAIILGLALPIHSEESSNECRYACAYDECVGTWSNALPWGERGGTTAILKITNSKLLDVCLLVSAIITTYITIHTGF